MISLVIVKSDECSCECDQGQVMAMGTERQRGKKERKAVETLAAFYA
jgi:hypothetical protein